MRSYSLHQFKLLYIVFNTFLNFRVFGFLFWYKPVRALPQDLRWVGVWTLNGPLQHAGSFALQPFYRFTAVLWIIVPVTQFWPGLSFNQTDGLSFKGSVYGGTHCPFPGSMVSSACGCKTSPFNHLSSKLGLMYDVFLFWPNISTFDPFMSKHIIPDVLLFV